MNQQNSIEALDLYSKVEDLLCLDEAANRLYAHYLLALNSVDFETLLDVGCGSGRFMLQMQNAFPDSVFSGIDLSPQMVAKSKSKGLDARVANLCDVTDTFDVIVAVFDMLNYLNDEDLKSFLRCVENHLTKNALFIFDINTLYGFTDVSVGSINIDDDDRFLAIDSDFEDGVYSADFTLFESSPNGYQKTQESVNQYYHTLEDIVKYTNLELISHDLVCLYAQESDKEFVVFQKRTI